MTDSATPSSKHATNITFWERVLFGHFGNLTPKRGKWGCKPRFAP